jgi:segregation and condensation protein B
LKDVNDLPSMEEFEKMAGELAESEAEGEAQDVVNLASSPTAESAEAHPEAQASEEQASEEQASESQQLTSPGIEGQS